MNICSIYIITNSVNNKVYIGQTWRNINKRFHQHCNDGGSPKISRAINKYGKENFVVSVLATTKTQKDADTLEQFWIAIYDSTTKGYNIKDGGFGGKLPPNAHAGIKNPMYGKKHSNLSKDKISESNKGNQVWLGKNHSVVSKNKMSISRSGNKNHAYGKKFSFEHKKKLSIAHKGISFSKEHKQNLSNSSPRNSGDKNANSKITQIIADQIRISRANHSLKELSNIFNLSVSQIRRILLNKVWVKKEVLIS